MKRLVYGVAGEGLGHATRAHSLMEELLQTGDLDVHVFTFGDALNYFLGIQESFPSLYLYPIDGLMFGRNAGARINRLATIRKVADYFRKSFPRTFRSIMTEIQEIHPDVVITDFEPATAEAARRMGVPLVSVDNQHKFSHFSTDELPFGLRFYCNATGFVTDRLIGRTDGCVVSTFYHRHGKTTSKVTKTNIFVRKKVRRLSRHNGGYALVYWKSSIGPEMLKGLRKLDMPVKVFGLTDPLHGPSSWYKNFEYYPLDYESFAEALAGCSFLFCASGNQLLGEACYFGKPTFTVPEPNQHEQSVNAWYAERMGFARSYAFGRYSRDEVVDFVENFQATSQVAEDGTAIAAAVVRSLADGA